MTNHHLVLARFLNNRFSFFLSKYELRKRATAKLPPRNAIVRSVIMVFDLVSTQSQLLRAPEHDNNIERVLPLKYKILHRPTANTK